MSLHDGERTQFAGFCSVAIERDADTAFIRLEGELDLTCEDNIRAEVASRMASWCPSTVVVDLRDVTFIDPRGLRILLELDAASREDGFELTLVHADGQVQKVLRITGLDRLLPLETMTTSGADIEATAFLGMAQNLHDALTERENLVRSYRERYERLQDDLRMAPAKRVKAAAEFLQAAYRADHIYGERVEEGLEKYRRLTSTEAESRY